MSDLILFCGTGLCWMSLKWNTFSSVFPPDNIQNQLKAQTTCYKVLVKCLIEGFSKHKTYKLWSVLFLLCVKFSGSSGGFNRKLQANNQKHINLTNRYQSAPKYTRWLYFSPVWEFVKYLNWWIDCLHFIALEEFNAEVIKGCVNRSSAYLPYEVWRLSGCRLLFFCRQTDWMGCHVLFCF